MAYHDDMRKLLDLAGSVSDQAEVFHSGGESSSIAIRNGMTTEVSATIQSGFSLRLLKNGKLGTAYTKNLLDAKGLVDNALASMKGNVEAGFSFPSPSDVPESPQADESIGSMGLRDLHHRAERILEYLEGKVEGLVAVQAMKGTSQTSIMNSGGLDLTSSLANMILYTSVLFPNTETSISRLFLSASAGDFPEEQLDEIVNLYEAGLPVVDIPTGKMNVVFTPDTMYTLLWRLSSAASGASFYNRVSPLMDKLEKQVVSGKFTLYGDPTDDEAINKRYFDDEGVPTGRHTIFDKGVFKGLVLNLDYASKLGMKPTGTGYRGGMFGGETVSIQPSPSLQSGRIAPGDVSFSEMIAGMERGVIVLGVLGAHSGNILNGDFSVGLNPGLYVENGEIRGRVRDGMVAGNVYDVLGRIEAIESSLHDSIMGGRYPSIMLGDVSVAAK